MTNLKDLSTEQLQRIISIKQQIEELELELDQIGGGGGRRGPGRPKGIRTSKRKMSAAGRRAISMAAKARWAKYRGKGKAKAKPAKKKDRRSSPAVKAKLRAIAKARWAKAKAEGKTAL
jgi:hypothetical protein